MAYQVFARKYRPQTFDQVVGQEHITRTLENAIKMDRIAQAYLFVGPRGTGKTSTARILAKALNASDGPRVDFDPDEGICKEIAEGNCMDVLEIDGASNNGVEQVRDLRDNVRYAPAKGRYKIYIIDEVHMLSVAAFNALLKTLEEPPAHVKFLFATTEVHKLPATILSRCQRFDLRRIPEAKIAEHLAWICGQEEVEAEAAALEAIARYAEGGLRDAESALDQVISFFGEKVTEADVLTMFGLTGLRPVAGLAKAIAGGDTVAAMKLSRELITAGKDLGRLSQDLLRFFRNVTLGQISPEVIAAELPPEEVAAVQEVAGMLRRQGALAILEELSMLESRLRYALAKDVLFEVALIQLSQLREKVSLEKILSVIATGGEVPAPAAIIKEASVTLDPVKPSEPAKVGGDHVVASPGEVKPAPKGKPASPPNEKPAPAAISKRDEPQSVVPSEEPKTPTPSPSEEGGAPAPSPEAEEAPAPKPEQPEAPAPKAEKAPSPGAKAEDSAPALPREAEKSSASNEKDTPDEESFSANSGDEEISPFRSEADEPAPAPEAKPAPATRPKPVSHLKAEPVPQPKEKWKAAKAKFRAQRELECELIDAMYFMSCRVNAFDIGVPTEFENKMPWLRGPKNAGLLKDLLEEACGGPVELAFVERDDPTKKPALPQGPPPEAEKTEATPNAPAEEEPERMTQEEYENDPLIAQALELFDAKIAPAK